MRELVVISGKGGTGKTSIVGAFATLAKYPVLADCDVDAPDLAIIMRPFVLRREPFSGGSQARIRTATCAGCGTCREVCRFGAISDDGPGNEMVKRTFRVDPIACEGCGVCSHFCPTGALIFSPTINGEWFISTTRAGPMVHAKLGVAQENSGKLINIVRIQAKKIAVEEARDLILIDGPPGIGCPAIASITGSDLVLVVTEPTLSGVHDFSRVVDLTEHFHIETLLLVNKWDLNRDLTLKLEKLAQERNVRVIGKIHFGKAFTEAQIRKQTIVEFQNDGVAEEIGNVWTEISRVIDRHESSVMEGHSSSDIPSTFQAPRSGRDKGGQKGWP